MNEELKNAINALNDTLGKLDSTIANVKELSGSSKEGGKSMTDAEKKELEEAKAAEEAAAKKKAEAEAKAAEEAEKAEAAAKAEAEAKEKAEAEAAEKEKAEAEAKEKAEADKIAAEAEAAKAAAEAEAQEAAAKAAAEADEATTEKAKELMKKTLASALSEDVIKDFGFNFSESEASLAKKYGYEDLVKVVARVSLELAGLKEDAAKAEATAKGEERFKELSEAGVVFKDEEKAEAQKKRVTDMSDEAYASYKDELVEMKKSFASTDEGTDENKTQNEIEKAKLEAGEASVDTDVPRESLQQKYSKL